MGASSAHGACSARTQGPCPSPQSTEAFASALGLRTPQQAHEAQVMAYRAEFAQAGETARLEEKADCASWLSHICSARQGRALPPGLAPVATLLCLRKADGKLVGIVDIRHRLNDHLSQDGGHIGYRIRGSEQSRLCQSHAFPGPGAMPEAGASENAARLR